MSVARQLTLERIAPKFKDTQFLVNAAHVPLGNKARKGDFVSSPLAQRAGRAGAAKRSCLLAPPETRCRRHRRRGLPCSKTLYLRVQPSARHRRRDRDAQQRSGSDARERRFIKISLLTPWIDSAAFVACSQHTITNPFRISGIACPNLADVFRLV